jgi:hypothetical protein
MAAAMGEWRQQSRANGRAARRRACGRRARPCAHPRDAPRLWQPGEHGCLGQAVAQPAPSHRPARGRQPRQ